MRNHTNKQKISFISHKRTKTSSNPLKTKNSTPPSYAPPTAAGPETPESPTLAPPRPSFPPPRAPLCRSAPPSSLWPLPPPFWSAAPRHFPCRLPAFWSRRASRRPLERRRTPGRRRSRRFGGFRRSARRQKTGFVFPQCLGRFGRFSILIFQVVFVSPKCEFPRSCRRWGEVRRAWRWWRWPGGCGLSGARIRKLWGRLSLSFLVFGIWHFEAIFKFLCLLTDFKSL